MSDLTLLILILAIVAAVFLWRVLKRRDDSSAGRPSGGRSEPRDRTRER